MDVGQRDVSADAASAQAPEVAAAKRPARRSRPARSDPAVARAMEQLAASGQVTGSRSLKIGARVDPGVFAAAAQRFGLREDQVSEVINAALAIVAKPDTFKAWMRGDHPPFPDDFELAI